MLGERLIIANRKAKKVWKKYHDSWADDYPSEPPRFGSNKYVPYGAYRKTKVFCSNPFCCGNPRKMRGTKNPSIQEKKAPTIDEEWY